MTTKTTDSSEHDSIRGVFVDDDGNELNIVLTDEGIFTDDGQQLFEWGLMEDN